MVASFGSGGRKKPGRDKNWVKDVTTVSTFPPAGLYKQDAKTIAEVMAKPEVSPRGLVSAIQMVQFYINRAGRKLPEERREVLEEAKRLLQEMHRQELARPNRPLTDEEYRGIMKRIIEKHPGMTIPQIAEKLGRTEQWLRERLHGNATVPGESHPATTGEKIPRSG